jgi:hypothetical protein
MVEHTTTATDPAYSSQSAQSVQPPTRERARALAAENLTRAREIIDTEMADSNPQTRVNGEVRIQALISIATEWRYLAEEL